MQLKRVSVRSLFGRFDHDIPINLDERITIITAPNGYGKTVILNLITYFLTGQFNKIMRYNFDTMEFTFEDDSKIKVHGVRQEDLLEEKGRHEAKELRFESVNVSKEAEVWNYRIDPERMMRRTSFDFERYIPFLERIDRDQWL